VNHEAPGTETQPSKWTTPRWSGCNPRMRRRALSGNGTNVIAKKRGDGSVRTLSEQEVDTISRRLGIDSPRFSQISQNLHAVKWISQNVIRGWQKWQGARTPEEDAARKQAEYWKQKALLGKGLENITDVSPKASQSLPKPP
jgi:hypothetical protein